jgi:hypothetical protein
MVTFDRIFHNNIHAMCLIVVAFLAGCTAPPCQPGAGHPMLVFNLYFGRSISGGGQVSDQEWRAFREQVISPALPDGYTVLDGEGSWMSPRSHTTISEATKILVVAMPDTARSQSTIDHVRAVWQHRFHQYVVGMTVYPACGSFSAEEAPR